MGKLFLDVARAAAAALAFMFATSTGHAATLTSASAVTLPSTIGASTTIGPQTVQVSLTQQYTATFPVNLRLSISDANFVTTSVAPPTLTVSGSVTGGGCTLDSYPTVLIIVCTPVGSNTITGLTIAGLNYTAATTLSSGGSIKLSGALTNTAGTITAEELPSTAVVQAAVATPTTYTLTTSTTGSGTGTVSVTPSSGPYAAGTIVTLTATAASGSTFTHWTGGGCSTSATCAVTMNENQTVSATFTAAATTPGNPSDGAGSVNSRRLTVNPVGGGTVTSNPNGINCTTECSTNFAINQAVVLTAVPGPGSQVISWSGCAPIYASPTSCLITMAGDASVTVTFFAHSGATSNVVQ